MQEASRWVQKPRVCSQGPNVPPPELGAMPAASGRAGGMLQHGTGWGVGPGAAPLGSGLAVTGTTVASQEDRDEQRREGREEGERGAVGLHPPTFPLNKRQG